MIVGYLETILDNLDILWQASVSSLTFLPGPIVVSSVLSWNPESCWYHLIQCEASIETLSVPQKGPVIQCTPVIFYHTILNAYFYVAIFFLKNHVSCPNKFFSFGYAWMRGLVTHRHPCPLVPFDTSFLWNPLKQRLLLACLSVRLMLALPPSWRSKNCYDQAPAILTRTCLLLRCRGLTTWPARDMYV